MRYWIKFHSTNLLVGRSKGRGDMYAYRQDGGRPMTAKECALAKKNKSWAGDIVKAGRIHV